MNFGIIGVGAIGGTIAKKLAKAGHSVKVANSRGKRCSYGICWRNWCRSI